MKPERLRDLEFIANRWLEGKMGAKRRFDELVSLRNSSRIVTPHDVEFLNGRIEAEDVAISEYEKALRLANSLVDRAKAGEDV